MGKEEGKVNEENRARWGSHLEFLLAGVGLAVGTGNVWRFPYLAQKNGGGAFLVPYCIMLAVEGVPLFFMELALGQRFQQGSIKIWSRIRPYLKGIGFAQVVVSFSMTVYYPIVMTWCMYYFYLSFSNPLPWVESECDTTREDFECCKSDPAKHFYYVSALQVTSSISENGGFVNGVVICWVISWVLTYACLFKGPESLGKAAYFTATFPYVVLFCLFCRGVSLKGAGKGIAVLFTPDFSVLYDPNVWMDAAGQIFYSLSVGFGALICFASYNPIKNDCCKDSMFISLVNCGTSVFSGIVVYSILGFREETTGIKVADVEGGPGLAFIAYTTAVAEMPLPQLWAAAFFFMMVTLALNSEFGTVEACVTPLRDFKIFAKMPRELLCLVVCCVMFLVGLPMCCRNGLYVFNLWDNYSVTIPLLCVGLMECIGVMWIYGMPRFLKDIEYMTGSVPHRYWQICWKWVSPLLLIIVLLSSMIKKMIIPETYEAFVGCEEHPAHEGIPGTENWNRKIPFTWWAQFFAALMVIAPVMWIPIYIVWKRNAEIVPIPYLQGMIDQGMVVEEKPFNLGYQVTKMKQQVTSRMGRSTGQNGRSYVVENKEARSPNSNQPENNV
ncbi:hypothetical protein ACHWQZ_G009358 [Mnemiopsis leidyi]